MTPTRPMRLLLAAIAALLLVVTGSEARAQTGPTLLVLTEARDAHRESLHTEASIFLGSKELAVISISDAELDGFKGERTIECLMAREDCSYLLSQAPAQWVLHLRSRVDADGEADTVYFVAKLYSGESGQLLQADQRVCERCTSDERAASAIRELVTDLTQAQIASAAPNTFLEIVGTPASASLHIDDELIGSIGQRYQVAPGRHQIRITHPGHLPQTQEVNLAANEHKSLRINLLPEDRHEKRDTASPLWGWLSIGAGSALLGTGVVLVAIDGDSEQSDQRDRLYDTKAIGFGGIATGTLLVGAGITWLLLGDDESSDELRVSTQPTAGGMSLGLEGRF